MISDGQTDFIIWIWQSSLLTKQNNKHLKIELQGSGTYKNGTCGIHNITTSARLGITAVNGRQQQLSLEMGAPLDVLLILQNKQNRFELYTKESPKR